MWKPENVKKGKIQKIYTADISKSTSRALLRNSSLLFYPESQFSNLVRSFSSSVVTNKVAPFSEDTGQLYDFYSVFVRHENYEFVDLDDLLKKQKDISN